MVSFWELWRLTTIDEACDLALWMGKARDTSIVAGCWLLSFVYIFIPLLKMDVSKNVKNMNMNENANMSFLPESGLPYSQHNSGIMSLCWHRT